jgi:hypothetical protein
MKYISSNKFNWNSVSSFASSIGVQMDDVFLRSLYKETILFKIFCSTVACARSWRLKSRPWNIELFWCLLFLVDSINHHLHRPLMAQLSQLNKILVEKLIIANILMRRPAFIWNSNVRLLFKKNLSLNSVVCKKNPVNNFTFYFIKCPA